MARRTGITITEDSLTTGAHKLKPLIERTIFMVMQVNTPQAENWMKTNAPWTDRTTNARNGLAARYGRDGTMHRMVLFHQVDYGIWLEVTHDGRNAIIDPALREFGPKVMKDIVGLLDRIHPVGGHGA